MCIFFCEFDGHKTEEVQHVHLLEHRVNGRSGERVSGTATGARHVQLLERREIGRAGDPVNG